LPGKLAGTENRFHRRASSGIIEARRCSLGVAPKAETNALPARSDIRLKFDVALLGCRNNGLGVYRFGYTGSDKRYVGALASQMNSNQNFEEM
jgi:hypothetical protein